MSNWSLLFVPGVPLGVAGWALLMAAVEQRVLGPKASQLEGQAGFPQPQQHATNKHGRSFVPRSAFIVVEEVAIISLKPGG